MLDSELLAKASRSSTPRARATESDRGACWRGGASRRQARRGAPSLAFAGVPSVPWPSPAGAAHDARGRRGRRSRLARHVRPLLRRRPAGGPRPSAGATYPTAQRWRPSPRPCRLGSFPQALAVPGTGIGSVVLLARQVLLVHLADAADRQQFAKPGETIIKGGDAVDFFYRRCRASSRCSRAALAAGSRWSTSSARARTRWRDGAARGRARRDGNTHPVRLPYGCSCSSSPR